MRRYGESKTHEKAKERIGEILSAQGWKVWVDTYAFECETAKGPRTYWPDVYAESPEYSDPLLGGAGHGVAKTGARRIIVEVQGSKGKGNHSTKIHRGKDKNRMDDIWACHGFDIIYYPLHLWAIKGASDEDIREELGLT